MRYDKPVTLQVMNETTEAWSNSMTLHAIVNKTGGGESYNAGADQYHRRLTFDFRYSTALAVVAYSPQLYRLQYQGHTYNILDYDDYMEQHRTIRIVGELYG